MATTVDQAAALAHYQTRVGNMANEIIMRDIAIAALEEERDALKARLADRGQAAPADPAYAVS